MFHFIKNFKKRFLRDLNLTINLAWVSVCLFVCLCPINVKTEDFKKPAKFFFYVFQCLQCEHVPN